MSFCTCAPPSTGLQRICVFAMLCAVSSTTQAQATTQPAATETETKAAQTEAQTKPTTTTAFAAWTVERCVEAALHKHPEVEFKAQEVSRAQGQLDEARSNFFPNVTWRSQAMALKPFFDPIVVRSGSLGQMYVPAAGGGTVIDLPASNIQVAEAPDRWFSSGVILQQPLFTSGRILLGVRLAEINKRLAEQQLKSTRYASVYVVRQIILALLMAEASVELLQDMHGEMSRILDDTYKLEVQGMATTADVLEAQANLQFIEKTTADAISEQVHAREGLRLLVGATDDDPMRIAGSLEETNSKVGLLATSSDDAVALKRPEIRERELQLELAHKQVSLKQAEGIFRPTIALSLEGGLRGDRIPVAQSNWTMAWDNYYMAAIVLDLKLFDGGEAGSKADQAQAQAAQATLGLEQSRRMLSSELRRARAQLQAKRSALQASDARVAEHSEKRRVAVQSFDAGAMGRSEYLAAHLKWSEARTSRLVALYELRLAELELEHAAALLPTTP